MRKILLVAALFAPATLLTPGAAWADITVLTSGGTNPGLRTLAAKWEAETGKKVTIVGGTVTRARDNVKNKVPADLVLLTVPELTEVSANLKPATLTPLGRVHFGLAVKAGAPKPDISTMPKFIAVLKEGSGVGFTDPARGSAAGKIVSEMLARPEFAGVKPMPIAGTPGLAIARDGIQYAIGPISEEVTVPGVDVVSVLPKEVARHFDYSAAVLGHATQPDEAAAFMAYLTRPEARPVWKETGVENPD